MTRLMLPLVPILALLSSCSREASTAPPTATAPAAPSGPSASETLDQMDERAPVPLLPMMANHQKAEMRDHLAAVQEIVAALATDDYPAIEKAAARIGSSEQTGQMCTHMGAAASDFTEQALAFHRTADGIAAAARERDRTRVLAELGTTMQACTSCHATWKQQVVDEPTWERLTASAPPTHGDHGAQH